MKKIPPEYALCASFESRRLTVNHTLRTFLIAIEREKAGGGHVQPWSDLYEEDKHWIDAALDPFL